MNRLSSLLILTAAVTAMAVPCLAQVTADQVREWTEQLTHFPTAGSIASLKIVREHPDAAFAIARDHWSDLSEESERPAMLSLFLAGDSPHLLDLLDIAIRDENTRVQYFAEDALIGFGFRNFSDGPTVTYTDWRKSTAGKSAEQVVREEEAHFFDRLAAAKDPVARTAMLTDLLRVDFSSGSKLAKLRRQLADQNHALDIMYRLLSPPEAPTVLELYVLRILCPDEAYLRKVVAPLTAPGVSPPVRYAALVTLSTLASRAGAETLNRMLAGPIARDDVWIALQALSAASDHNMIPVLIAVLEAEDDARIDELLQPALLRLTGVFEERHEMHDGGWWRLWWKRNQRQFTDVADRRIPHFRQQLQPQDGERVNRREVRWREISGDPMRGYWLIRPPYMRNSAARALHANFGLIVVIGAPGTEDDLADYWSNAAQNALKDGYLIAVPAAPELHGKPVWQTRKTRIEGGKSATDVENFASQVVEDVARTVPIDGARCFLHAVGDGGPAGYACTLTPGNPFHGAYIVACGFNSALLPSLSGAKGRRYYLQYAPKDAAAPLWQITAAGAMLTKNGAVVKSVGIPGDHGYKFEGDPWKPVADAVAWLERGR